jgi:hypothetical protein
MTEVLDNLLASGDLPPAGDAVLTAVSDTLLLVIG